MQSVLGPFLLMMLLIINSVQSFAPQSRTFNPAKTGPFKPSFREAPEALQRQRRSVAPVQTMGLFGLGAPEIAIILIAGAFVLGPQKLAELGKDAGRMAGELKEVPKEFQKGLQEGEEQAKKLKEASPQDAVVVEKEESKS